MSAAMTICFFSIFYFYFILFLFICVFRKGDTACVVLGDTDRRPFQLFRHEDVLK